jgi:AcrR family transcriptional regulator
MSLTTDTASVRGLNLGAPIRKTRRAIAKEQTAQKVLAAAEALFVEEGFEAATIREIAKRAGMSTGAVFASYEDKAHLLAAVLERHLDALREHLSEVRARRHGSPAVRIDDAFRFEYEAKHLALALLREKSVGFPDSEGVIRKHARHYQAALSLFVLDMVRSLSISSPVGEYDRHLIAALIVAAHHSNLQKLIAAEQFPNPEIRFGAMVEFLLR